MNFLSLPVEILTLVMEGLTPKDKLSLCLVNKEICMMLVPELWATGRIKLTADRIRNYFLTITSSRFFGDSLACKTRHLILENFPIQSCYDYNFPIAESVFQSLTRMEECPRGIVGASPAQDLLWMALVSSPSLRTLRIGTIFFAQAGAPALRARLPLPMTFDRLTELDIDLLITTTPSAPSSLFDCFGTRTFPTMPALRKLKITLILNRYGGTREYPSMIPPDLSSVQDLEICQQGWKPGSSARSIMDEAVLRLIRSTRAERLTIHGFELTLYHGLWSQFPRFVDTVIMQDNTAWEAFFMRETHGITRLKRLMVETEADSIASNGQLRNLPSMLREVHLLRKSSGYPPPRWSDWTETAELSKLPRGELSHMISSELEQWLSYIFVVHDLVTWLPQNHSLKSVILDTEVDQLDRLGDQEYLGLIELPEWGTCPFNHPLNEDQSEALQSFCTKTLPKLKAFAAESNLEILIPKRSFAMVALVNCSSVSPGGSMRLTPCSSVLDSKLAALSTIENFPVVTLSVPCHSSDHGMSTWTSSRNTLYLDFRPSAAILTLVQFSLSQQLMLNHA